MEWKRVVSFLLNGVFNIAMLVLAGYLLIYATGKFYNMGKDMAVDITKELEPREITVVIEPESTMSEVASVLEGNGVITSAIFFRLENLLKGNNYIFAGGELTFNTTMSTTEIVYTLLEKPSSSDIAITIKEGFTVKDIALYLANKEIVTEEEFITACNEGKFDYDFLDDIPVRENRLEGYLFPDTYYLAEHTTAEDIIDKMLTRFEDIYGKYEVDAKALGLTMDEVMTVASIIEKEISVDTERALAAEVIYNRLESNTNLQMCSTVLYVLDKKKDRLYEADLLVESPYNTYRNEGLPVGPISNPGEACIKAAVTPSEGNLLYFVVKDEKSGEHFFTHDYDAFLGAKAQYNQKF